MLVFDFFKILCYSLGILASIYLAYKGEITSGQFGACIAAFSSLQGSIWMLFRQLSGFIGNVPFVEDYFKFLNINSEKWGDKKWSGVYDKIEIKSINFTYPGLNQRTLQNISLTINKGEKVAVVGENGSGKTTLSKIIMGLYQPESGEVLYDGKDLKQHDISSYYARVSTVSQYFTKYLMTLRENIGISDIPRMNTDNDIMSVLERTDIKEAVEKTKGLDGMIGREFGGAELSGGQWQKLSISRSLFKDYDFIVLDEPTSALDPIVETQIFTKFLEAMNDKTALIISHRVGFCRLADKIIVMKDGRICETGTHDRLMALNGHYHMLFTSQQGWYV